MTYTNRRGLMKGLCLGRHLERRFKTMKIRPWVGVEGTCGLLSQNHHHEERWELQQQSRHPRLLYGQVIRYGGTAHWLDGG